MIQVGIKELKDKLSRYLSYVKKGEEVLITERGTVIARIIYENHPHRDLYQSLKPLILKGNISMPSRNIDKNISKPLEVQGKPVSEMVIEDRR